MIPIVINKDVFKIYKKPKNISSVQSLSRVQLFAIPWITARQASLSITNSWSSPKLMCIESVMPSRDLILCRPLLQLPLQSHPASGSFPMSKLFACGGQSIGVSALASVLPINLQDWFSLGLTSLISSLQGTLLIYTILNTECPMACPSGFLFYLHGLSCSPLVSWL